MNEYKDTLDYLRHELEQAYYKRSKALNYVEVLFLEEAIKALKHTIKMTERYNKMAEHVAESGITCEHMPLNNPWCEKHCSKRKPDMECTEQWLDWSDKE